MTPRLPVAARPLALLTLAVAAAHLLVLRQSMQEPQRPAVTRNLVTRVLQIGSAGAEAPGQAAAPVSEEKRPAASTNTRFNAINLGAKAIPRPTAPQPLAAPDTEPAAADTAAETGAPASSTTAASPPAGTVTAFAIPASVRLRYEVTGQSRGQQWNFGGALHWRHDGSSYDARLDYASPLLPSRSQHSTGRITAEGLEPLRFSDKGRGERATHFERDSGTLVFSSNAPQQALLPGVQDRLSVFLQLAAMLAGDPAKYPAGTGIALQTAGTRDAQPWLFTVEGDESLVLPGGTVATRKLVRGPRHEHDIRVELWLGTAMDYIPVRIRLTQPNGDFVDQQWASTDRS